MDVLSEFIYPGELIVKSFQTHNLEGKCIPL